MGGSKSWTGGSGNSPRNDLLGFLAEWPDLGFDAWWEAHRFEFFMAPVVFAACGLIAAAIHLARRRNGKP